MYKLANKLHWIKHYRSTTINENLDTNTPGQLQTVAVAKLGLAGMGHFHFLNLTTWDRLTLWILRDG